LKIKLILVLMLTSLSIAAWRPATAAADVELVPSERVILEINEGMTIDRIIQRVYPRDRALWPRIEQKLIETNPDSFEAGTKRLIPGQRLKLVDIKRADDEADLPSRTRVGFVTGLQGNASSSDANGRVADLQLNSAVYEGDRIETDPESRLRIRMDDGATIMLKGNSVLKVTEYVITQGYDAGSSSVLDLLRGGLRAITGAIGANRKANYELDTGVAAIGIRGTDYVIKLCKLDDCTQTVNRNDPSARLHAAVLEGAITLTIRDGRQISMAMGDYGSASRDSLAVEDRGKLPAGLLSAEEARRFDAAVKQQPTAPQRQSADAWKWILGILLFAAVL